MKKSLLKIAGSVLVILLITSTFTFSYADQLTPYRTGVIEGFVKSIGADRVEIEEYDGTIHILALNSAITFSIDNRPAVLTDFKVGMEVYATLKGKSIEYLESYSTEVPGYIPEGSKIRTGVIKKIDRDQIIVSLATGKDETYFTSPATIALKKGNNVSLNVLYEGDRVKLFFDEVNSDIISRLSIEGDTIKIKDLYRGVLAASDTIGNISTFTGVEVFKNGQWESLSSSKSIRFSAQVSAYVGGMKVAHNNLKYYKGKTAYMAVKDFFGRDQIERIVIKNQYESIYSDKIVDVNWYSEAFELKNNKNLSFNDGTIIMKNGRLVDKYSIYSDSDAFIVGDGRGSQLMADVIYVYNEDINNSNIGQDYLYEGRLNEIIKDKVVLKDFCILDKNEWESFNEEKELYYDNDVIIYDMEAGKQITSEEFYSEHYAVDEDSDYADDYDLKDWYAYAYTDGDRISSIMVQKKRDSLLKQRTTNGIIESIEDHSLVGWKMGIRDAKDWSARKDTWMAKNTSLSILLREAMIIEDGKIITPEELKVGDRLYVVRDDSKAKVVIVK
ncbi:MAG: hypothetical protein AB7G87_08590 [Clostridia bacterium]